MTPHACPAARPQALLAVLAESPGALSDLSEGLVLNVNFPPGDAPSAWQGVRLTHQGTVRAIRNARAEYGVEPPPALTHPHPPRPHPSQ